VGELKGARRWLVAVGLVSLLAFAAACGDDNGTSPPPPPTSYSIGGSVSGLTGGSLTLQLNGGDDLPITANGDFEFTTQLLDGSNYTVNVSTQPADHTCTVSNGSGTVSGADVENVAVNCSADTHSVGGLVTGLTGGTLVLQNNGGDDQSVTADGVFTFGTELASGSSYLVSISVQPAGQTCTVSSGSGTITGADVTDVAIGCSANTYTVGGTVTGLTGGTVIVLNNGGDELSVSADGDFQFVTPLVDGSNYIVTVSTQPVGQTCAVSNESGTISGANVSDVAVTCTNNTYTVGGTASGLTGGTLVLQNNGGDDLSVTANGIFTFVTPVPHTGAYEVTVAVQPAAQTCAVSNGGGTINAADVTDVIVSCTQVPPLVNRIVFHSERGGDFEIYAMNTDGTGVVQLTNNNADDLWPAVSPDGSAIAFYTDRDGGEEIYVMNADGSGQRRLTTSGRADRQPTWSPNGGRIAFHQVVQGFKQIFTIRPDGTGLRQLTNNNFDDAEPAWSPDGLEIAFTSDRDGNAEIYTMSALDGETVGLTNLTNNLGRDSHPDWSPDGTMIMFDRNDAIIDAAWLGSSEIMCMGSDGSGVVRMTTDTSAITDFQPRWSPNSTRLVFVSDRDGPGVNNELYVADTNACAAPLSGVARVTIASGQDEAGDWSP
jgi:Tol biopolymer transport system component